MISIRFPVNYPSIHKNLVDVYHKLDKLKEADEIISNRIVMDPENADANFGLAYLFQIKNNWEKAHQLYDKVIELNSDILEAYEKK